MLLVYDADNVLHITNEKGLRWNYEKTQKPQFGFEYDFLFYNPFDDEKHFILNDEEVQLEEEAIQEIEEYIRLCDPPAEITLQTQFIEDLQEDVQGRINRVFELMDSAGFTNTAELLIASREMSNDPRRQIGRRILDWVDFINGVNYRIREELQATIEVDLKPFDDYLNQLPSIPSFESFHESTWADDRFDNSKNSDTLDVKGGQEDLAEDKRAV